MAVYKIFPSQDSTIYSAVPKTNAGIDEILEIGSYNNKSGVVAQEFTTASGTDDLRRTLIQFDTGKMRSITSLASGSYSAHLKMYIAEATNLAQGYKVEVAPLAKSWAGGLGKLYDVPANTGGVSWIYRSAVSYGVEWDPTDFYFIRGGGEWYTSSIASQSFNFASNKDLNVDVTSIVNRWLTGSIIPNNGFIVKLPSTGNIERGDVIENNPNSFIGLKFYSMDTHTIYPPCLEVKWNDFTTNSVNLQSASFINTDQYTLVSNNNMGTYQNDTVYKFSFKAREIYPTRRFTTSSIYLDWKYLPTESYWAIQDYKTKEMAIDFDTTATKLSLFESGSYFNLYMDGLEPERSYKILIKSTLSTGETVVKDNDIIFKVIR